MEKEFIPYEQALALKELGFSEECFATIDQTEFIHIKKTKYPIRGSMTYNTIDVPLYQQAFRWFREKYGLEQTVNRIPPEVIGRGRIKKYNSFVWGENLNPRGYSEFYDTYEEAELECLKKLIEIVQESHKLNTDSN